MYQLMRRDRMNQSISHLQHRCTCQLDEHEHWIKKKVSCTLLLKQKKKIVAILSAKDESNVVPKHPNVIIALKEKKNYRGECTPSKSHTNRNRYLVWWLVLIFFFPVFLSFHSFYFVASWLDLFSWFHIYAHSMEATAPERQESTSTSDLVSRFCYVWNSLYFILCACDWRLFLCLTQFGIIQFGFYFLCHACMPAKEKKYFQKIS